MSHRGMDDVQFHWTTIINKLSHFDVALTPNCGYVHCGGRCSSEYNTIHYKTMCPQAHILFYELVDTSTFTMTTTPSEPSLHGITTDLLIPDRGQPVPLATVISKGSKIAWACSSESLPSSYARVLTTHGSYLLAGLWDCHVLFEGATSQTTGAYFATIPVHTGIRLARDAAATLNAGFTSVRDFGGFGCEVAKAIERRHHRGAHRIIGW